MSRAALASPARVVVDEAMERVTRATTDYLHDPSDERALEYARAIAALRIALEVLAHQQEGSS
jgi:electron transfer flavoprotein alpha/beta subunit